MVNIYKLEKIAQRNNKTLFISRLDGSFHILPHNERRENMDKVGRNVYNQLFIVGREVFTPLQ